MSKTISEITIIAAKWWADKVVNPKFDNGDKSITGGLTMAFAASLVEPIEKSILEAFIKTLSKYLEETLINSDSQICLGVDYGPDGVLRNFAQISGVPINNFPHKTDMWIDRNHVSVSYGYRAMETVLYANKQYYRERIKRAEESIEYYNKPGNLSYIKDLTEREQRLVTLITEIGQDIEADKVALEQAEE